MEKVRLHARRKGFSIIELLVVIGILAVLIAALLPFLGGSTEKADCDKCKNNMKNLALAMISCAQADDRYGHFPAAGYYRTLRLSLGDKDKRVYYPHRSWISNKGDIHRLNTTQSDVFMGSVVHFSDSEDDCRLAVTNGAIWQAVGASFDVFRCPIHERVFEKKNKRPPGWSYMMNQAFGYNREDGKPIGFCGQSIHNSISGRGHDKVLMFAEMQSELPGVNLADLSLKVASGNGTDAVLEYNENYDVIGFNHKLGKTKYGGNVAFTDGHVETIVMPKKMNLRDFTRHLCLGVDVPHDGSSYNVKDAD